MNLEKIIKLLALTSCIIASCIIILLVSNNIISNNNYIIGTNIKSINNTNTNKLDLSSSIKTSTNSVKPENIVITDDSGNLSTLTFPRGLIFPFYGDGTVNVINQVPSGWGVCDGTNGTPDLRGRFIRCVNSVVNPSDQNFQDGTNIPIYELGDIGGSTTSSFRLNESNLPHHSHTGFPNFYTLLDIIKDNATGYNNSSSYPMTEGTSSGLSSSCSDCKNTPISLDITNPYYTLIYIMKL